MKEGEKEFIIPLLSCRWNDKEYNLRPDWEEKNAISFILLRENEIVRDFCIIHVHNYALVALSRRARR